MIELSELRTILGDVGALDDRLAEARANAISQWEVTTGALWEARTDYVKVYRKRGSCQIWLPLVALTAVEVEAKALVADAYDDLVIEDDYTEDAPESLQSLTRLTPTGAWADFVRVTMTGGLLPATTPQDIKHALAMEVGFIFDRWSSANRIVESASLGDSTSTFLRKPAAPGLTLLGAATHHPVFTEAAIRYRVFSP